jgi:NhaA family Na+:H+ antiporter
MAALVLARVTGLSRLPPGANWAQAYGVAVITGIGFTMSLFIGGLAFSDPVAIVEMRVGVIGGSLLSALWGLLILWLSSRGKLVGA